MDFNWISSNKSGKRGKRLTLDHKPDNHVERQRIERSGGHIINRRLSGGLPVSRAFGNFNEKFKNHGLIVNPSISFQKLTSSTSPWVILASHGLWDAILDEEVASFVLENTTCSAQLIANQLVSKALSFGSKENVTVIAIKLNSASTLNRTVSKRSDRLNQTTLSLSRAQLFE